VLVVGIGAGDPEQITVQAIEALGRAEVLFVVDKGGDAEELVALRREICARYLEDGSYRIVAIPDPPRDRTTARYRSAVEDWRARRAEAWEAAVAAELGEDGCGAFLVWGDPSLYDSTLDVLERIRARGAVAFEHEVIPAVSSIHALTAAHRVALNRIGGSILITTGRRLAQGLPEGVDDVVVMLDADCSFRHLPPGAFDVYWGAYLGTPDEILVAGPLAEVGDEIVRARAAARARKGWVMDAYLLRRRSAE
jgi:precorrin-6A synthase